MIAAQARHQGPQPWSPQIPPCECLSLHRCLQFPAPLRQDSLAAGFFASVVKNFSRITRGQPRRAGVFSLFLSLFAGNLRWISSSRGRLSWADQNKQERRMSQGSTASHYRLRTSCHGRELCSSCSAQLDWNFEPVHEQLLVWRNAFALEIHVGEIRFGCR